MRRSPVLVHCVLAASVVVFAGCSSGGDDAATTTTTTTAETTSTSEAASTTEGGAGGTDDGDEVCPATSELETVIGGPVDVERSSGMRLSGSFERAISFAYDGCEARLTEGGQGEVSVSRIESAEVDGADVEGSVFAQLRDAAMADFEEEGFELLAELGAEAYRDGSEVVLLADDAMVFLEAEVDGEESVDAALEVAAALISSGQQLSPDDPDCEALGALAAETLGEISDTAVSGGSTIIGDLQFQTSGCRADHVNGDETSIDVTDASIWADWLAAKEASMFSASYVEHVIDGRDAFDDGDFLFVDDGDRPWVIEASGDDLDPDPAAVRLSLAELALGR